MPILEALGVHAGDRAGGLHSQAGRDVRLGLAAPSRGASSSATIPAGGRTRFRWCVRSSTIFCSGTRPALGADVREAHRVEAIDYDGARSRVHGDRRARRGGGGRGGLGDRRERPAGAARPARPTAPVRPVLQEPGGVRLLRGRASGWTAPLSGNILSAAFADGWFWFIPLHDGTTSVGAVVDAKRFAGEAAGDAAALYHRLIAACAPVAQRLRAARLRRPGARHPRLLLLQRSLLRPRLSARRRCRLLHRPGVLHRRAPRVPVRLSGGAHDRDDPSPTRRRRRAAAGALRCAATAPPSSATCASSTSSTTITPTPTRTSGRRARSSTPSGRSRRAPRSCA